MRQADRHTELLAPDFLIMRTISRAIVVMILALTPCLTAAGQTVLSRRLGLPGERLGASVAGLGDVDGDGVPDFVAAASRPTGAPGSVKPYTAARLLSGADSSVIYEIFADEVRMYTGPVRALGDLDGDGISDFSLQRQGNASNSGPGQQIVSGATGQFLYFKRVSAPMPIGDVDGDGQADFTALRRTSILNPWIAVVSGRSGVTLHSHALGTGLLGSGPVGDVNGDEIRDLAYIGIQDGQTVIRIVSGGDGTPLGSFPSPLGAPHFITESDDLDGDGTPDILLTHQPSPFEGVLSAYSGADGHELFSVRAPFIAKDLRAIEDQNGDGIRDLLISTRYGLHAAEIRSGLNGLLLTTVGTRKAGGVDVLGDVDGDGVPEIVLGHPGVTVSGEALGAVAVYAIDGLLGPNAAGNIAGGATLRINGADGGNVGRITVAKAGALIFDVESPETNTTPAPFVLFGTLGLPSATGTPWTAPLGAGTMIFAPCGDPGAPLATSFVLASSLAPQSCGALIPATPAPWTLRAVAGIPVEFEMTLQGIIETAPGTYGVTNALNLSVQ